MSFGNPKIPGRACGNPPLSRFHLPRKCWAAVGDAKCSVHCGEPAEILRYWKASSARRTGPLGPATPARIVTGTAHRSPAAGMTSQNGDPAFAGLTPWQGALHKGAFQEPSSNHSGRALHPIRATDRMERKAEPLRPRDASGRNPCGTDVQAVGSRGSQLARFSSISGLADWKLAIQQV